MNASKVNDALFQKIAQDIQTQGYSINPNAFDAHLSDALLDHVQQMRSEQFSPAGIGRLHHHRHNDFVRTNDICWINGESQAGRAWLDWNRQLQHYLNRHLFLGLFSFESHFAIYQAGDFYKRHLDAFKGEANRILSIVLYLNPEWNMEDGGELVLYQNTEDFAGIQITPLKGTVLVFLSEDFPHEVLPAKRKRISIAGWFRLNGSANNKIDPPL